MDKKRILPQRRILTKQEERNQIQKMSVRSFFWFTDDYMENSTAKLNSRRQVVLLINYQFPMQIGTT